MAEEEFDIDFYEDSMNHSQDDRRQHTDRYDDGYEQEENTTYSSDGHYNEGERKARDDMGSELPTQRGVKRKGEYDDRPVDSGSTRAVIISELSWWHTDDDIRGWVAQAYCEDELKDLTFSEHKVNGKSKGQVFIEFTSPQAATALKHHIENVVTADRSQPSQRRVTIAFSNSHTNPFRTLPKDVPPRPGKDGPNRAPSGPGYSDRGSHRGGNYGGGFRGRDNFGGGGRGNVHNHGSFNRNYSGSGPAMGGGFNNPMNNFNMPMGGGNFGFNRGGMMNMGGPMRGGPSGPGAMRGGRGGGMGHMMGGMGPMGGMPNQMGPMGMMGGMHGFQPQMQVPFGPGFFPQMGNPNPDWGNPHGAKRPRPE